MLPGGALGAIARARKIPVKPDRFANTHSVKTTGNPSAPTTAGHINLGQPPSWQLNLATTAFTWAIWFKYAASGRILSCRVSAGAQFDLSLAADALSCVMGDNFFSGGSGVADGNWHHVVCTARNEGGASCIARMFLDGNTSSIANTVAGSLTNTTIDWLVGHMRNTNNTDYAFGAASNMNFAHLTAWSVGFTGTESAELYNGGVPMNPELHSRAAFLNTYMPLGSSPGDQAPILVSEVGTVVGTMVNTGTCVVEAVHP